MSRPTFDPSQAGKYLKISVIGALLLFSCIVVFDRVENALPKVKILINQAGYLPVEEKLFYVQSPKRIDGPISFDLVDNANGNRVYNDTLVYAGEIWGDHYYLGNFSGLQKNGSYHISLKAENRLIRSYDFPISQSVYDRMGEYIQLFYYYQRCGMKPHTIVPGYEGHEACHLDDGLWFNGTEWVYKDLSGGWHDAGDYNKYTEDPYNTQYSAFALSFSYFLVPEFWDSIPSRYETDAPDIVDECVWGARFLQKLLVQDISGKIRALNGIFSVNSEGEYSRFGYWKEPAGETDNIPGTGDERKVGSLGNVSGMTEYSSHPYGSQFMNKNAILMLAAALANTANTQRYYPYWDSLSYSPSNLIINATTIFNDYKDELFFENGSELEFYSNISVSEAFCLMFAVSALARWHNISNEAIEYNKFTKVGLALREFFLNATQQFSGLKMQAELEPLAVWDLYMQIYSLFFFEMVYFGGLSSEFSDYLSRWADQTLISACESEGNVFRFAKNRDSYFSFWGTNLLLANVGGSALLAWNSTNKSSAFNKIKNYGLANGLHWIAGRNPLDICQIEGIGSKNLPIFHNRLIDMPNNQRGEVLGAINNGIAKPPATKSFQAKFSNEYLTYKEIPDVPYLDLAIPAPDRSNMGDFRTNEVYILNNAQFLMFYSIFRAILV